VKKHLANDQIPAMRGWRIVKFISNHPRAYIVPILCQSCLHSVRPMSDVLTYIDYWQSVHVGFLLIHMFMEISIAAVTYLHFLRLHDNIYITQTIT
jgi:hypothetical protein